MSRVDDHLERLRRAVALHRPLPDVLDDGVTRLERWRPGDEEVLSALVEASLEHLRGFMAFARDEPVALEVRRRMLDAWDAEWRRGAMATYKVPDERGAPCGSIGLHRMAVPQELHVGYWVAPWEEGRGRITRAATLLCVEALSHDEVDTVVITHDARNERSAAVPRRLGFARRRAETRDPEAGGSSGVTVRWEAHRGWSPRRSSSTRVDPPLA